MSPWITWSLVAALVIAREIYRFRRERRIIARRHRQFCPHRRVVPDLPSRSRDVGARYPQPAVADTASAGGFLLTEPGHREREITWNGR